MLGIKDILLTPVFVTIIYLLAFHYSRKHVKDRNHRKYFLSALTLKIVGAIALGLVYEFYYSGGDTVNYFNDIKYVNGVLYDDPAAGLKLIFTDFKNDLSLYEHLGRIIFEEDNAAYSVVRLGAIFSIFTFCTYSGIAAMFAVLSFAGIWALFKALVNIYPHLHKELAISIFYFPSVFFWGSGIMKDSVTLAALAFTFYAFTKIFIDGNRRPIFILYLITGLYVLKVIKIYIALCFIPAGMLYLFLIFSYKIKSKSLRMIIKPVLILLGAVIGYYATANFSTGDSKYNIANLAKTAKITSSYIAYVSMQEGGSVYDLGEYDATITGTLQKLPQAIWVTLFRPYLWESKSVIMLLSALESLIFLILTFKAIFKNGFWSFIRIINKNPYLQFALLFSLSFAFAIGISTYNFGTLVRYKIPLMPFYLSAILIINAEANKISRMRKNNQLAGNKEEYLAPLKG